MFCKVCKDAGKTETEYTSHYVKDKTGKVSCPTLLNQACKYCKQPGHTVKFCKTLLLNEKNKKLEEKNKRREDFFKKQDSEQQDKPNSVARKLGSSFAAAFGSDSEDESEDEYPTIMTVDIDLNDRVPIATNYLRSYSSVLADGSVSQVKNVKVSAEPFTVDTSHLKGKFWGDDEDSDDE